MHSNADWGRICRTCLSGEHSPLLSLHTQMPHMAASQAKTHLECLRTCTGQAVPAAGDGVGVGVGDLSPPPYKYPMNICLRCSKALQVAYHFTVLAKNSEDTLRAREEQHANATANATANGTATTTAERVLHAKEQVTFTPDDVGETFCDKVAFNSDIAATVGNGNGMVIDQNPRKVGYESNVLVERLENKTLELAVPAENSHLVMKSMEFDSQSTEGICCNIYYGLVDESPIETLDEPAATDSHGFAVVENLNSTPNRNGLIEAASSESVDATKDCCDAAENTGSLLECKLCNITFADMHTFFRHRNGHRGITPFGCNLCGFLTGYSESLRKHYVKQHNVVATNEMLNTPGNPPLEKKYHETTMQCLLCDFTTFKKSDIKIHVINEHFITEDLDAHISQAFNCPGCERTFKSQRNMHTHFTLMHGASMGIKKVSNDIFICEYCDKQFSFKVSLRSHQRACRLREAVSCNICGKKFVTVRKFDQHLYEEHGVQTIHECEMCGKAFKTPEYLAIHRKRHTERHFQCDLCPCNYINSSELRTHVQRVHGKAAACVCRTCGEQFTQVGLLRKHEAQQHFRRAYKCPSCDQQFATHCGLRLHRFKHTGKPYVCATCGKDFALRSAIRRHSLSAHGTEISDAQLAAMFHKKFGYPSRYDAFSYNNNSLFIREINDEDVEKELAEFGIRFDDIFADLFMNDVTATSGEQLINT